jgi:two-component system, OmpR family, response regulator VicR
MEIVVIYSDQKLLTNIDFLKTKLNGTFEVVQLAHFEAEFPKLNPDVVIFFHAIGITEHNQLDIVKKIKKYKKAPVLTVIPKNEHLLEAAFHHGADEVIYSPFSVQEFIIRIQAMLKRNEISHGQLEKIIYVHDLEIDVQNYQIKRNQQILPVTKLEFNIFLTLASHPNKVFMKKELYEMIWQDHYYDNGNVLNVHIRRLRKKIELDPENPKIIETKWGIGYKINMMP